VPEDSATYSTRQADQDRLLKSCRTQNMRYAADHRGCLLHLRRKLSTANATDSLYIKIFIFFCELNVKQQNIYLSVIKVTKSTGVTLQLLEKHDNEKKTE